MATRLKLYVPPEEEAEAEGAAADICVRLGDLLPLAAMAQRMNFIWLKDFMDDEVKISQDFYDVMQAFQENQPSRA